MKIEKLQLCSIPERPGVYIISSDNEIIYIGQSNNLRSRVSNYINLKDTRFQIPLMLKEATDINIIVSNNHEEALILEYNLIRKHNPKFNIKFLHAPTLKYVEIDKNSEAPKVNIVPSSEIRTSDNIINIGPIPMRSCYQTSINYLNDYFKLRQCSDTTYDKKTLCVLYQINSCSGPCDHKISNRSYLNVVNRFIDCLLGNKDTDLEKIKKIRDLHAKKENYEEAEKSHKAVQFIEKIRMLSAKKYKHSKTVDFCIVKEIGNNLFNVFLIKFDPFCTPIDVMHNRIEIHKNEVENFILEILFYHYMSDSSRIPDLFGSSNADLQLLIKSLKESINVLNNRKMSILTDKESIDMYHNIGIQISDINEKNISADMDILVNTLNIDKNINSIICADISHIGGKCPVGVVVEFISNELSSPSKIYNYKLEKENSKNDIFCMRELIKMHIKHLLENKQQIPELIIIDGGMAHRTAVEKTIDALKLLSITNVIAISKEKGDHSNKLTKDKIHLKNKKIINLHPESRALFILQNIRDVAHINTKKYMFKNLWISNKNGFLKNIPGIGKIYSEKILNVYLNINDLRTVSPEDLSENARIPMHIAKKVISYIKSNEKKTKTFI